MALVLSISAISLPANTAGGSIRNFKKNIYPVLFLAVIICMNQILILALKPCTNFRNDIHKLETNQYDDLFVGTSHGKAE